MLKMQCASCQAVYSNTLEACPRCRQKAADSQMLSATASVAHAVATAAHSEAPARRAPVATAARAAARAAAQATTSSTLIEFPGAGRAQQPAWRKQLSERVREIQERRARETTYDDSRARPSHVATSPDGGLGLVPSLPPAEERPVNPLVAAALARIERARQAAPQPQAPQPQVQQAQASQPLKSEVSASVSATRTHESIIPDQTARENVVPEETAREDVAREDDVVRKAVDVAPPRREEQPRSHVPRGVDVNSPAYLKYKQEEEARNRAKRFDAKHLPAKQAGAARVFPTTGGAAPRAGAALAAEIVEAELSPLPSASPSVAATDALRPAKLTAVSTPPAAPQAATQEAARAPRRVIQEVMDDAMLARLEAQEEEEARARRKASEDYAPLTSRIAGGVIDMLAVIFLSSPIAAAFELAYSDWSDSRVMLTMLLSIVSITFLYVAAATALAGRTWGMALLSLRTVDVETGMIPTTGQALRRGVAYVGSLALLGLGFLYALIDPERRGAHDHLSGTVVVRE